MSKQHIIPDRLKRVLPRTRTSHSYKIWKRLRQGTDTLQFTEKLKTQTGSAAARRLRRVCKPCNEGWLNDLEQDCAPVLEQLITGEKFVLLPADQLRIARIATSIAMVAEYINTAVMVTPQSERELFRETLTPPPRWYVFIGRNLIDFEEPTLQADGGLIHSEPYAPGEKLYLSTAISLGPILLHVLCVNIPATWDVDDYARTYGIAPVWPQTDWIDTNRMPFLLSDDVDRLVLHVRTAVRKRF